LKIKMQVLHERVAAGCGRGSSPSAQDGAVFEVLLFPNGDGALESVDGGSGRASKAAAR